MRNHIDRRSVTRQLPSDMHFSIFQLIVFGVEHKAIQGSPLSFCFPRKLSAKDPLQQLQYSL